MFASLLFLLRLVSLYSSRLVSFSLLCFLAVSALSPQSSSSSLTRALRLPRPQGQPMPRRIGVCVFVWVRHTRNYYSYPTQTNTHNPMQRCASAPHIYTPTDNAHAECVENSQRGAEIQFAVPALHRVAAAAAAATAAAAVVAFTSAFTSASAGAAAAAAATAAAAAACRARRADGEGGARLPEVSRERPHLPASASSPPPARTLERPRTVSNIGLMVTV